MMGELILIVIAVILAAKGDYTLFWIFGGIIVLALICSAFGKGGSSPSVSRERPRTRIDIPHYYDADEHVCTICGTRFGTDTMTCPHCGVRFNHVKTDDRAFIEEEDEEEWWEEMEEESR